MCDIRYLTRDKVPTMFRLCWLVYFTAYIGRLGYAAVMAEIIAAEGFSKAACGLVGTGFFLCYGAGQLFSGFAGDRAPPRWMLTIGLIISLACNALMGLARSPGTLLVIWCVNGAAQSMLWTPILRVFAEYFPPEYRRKACVNIASSYPLGTLLIYAAAALLINIASWRAVFILSAAVMAVTAVVWFIWSGRLERYRTLIPELDADSSTAETVQGKAKLSLRPWLVSALVMICVALALHGAFRDGVTTWLPTYLSAGFSVSISVSILLTAVLPVINLLGVKAADVLVGRLGRDELQGSLLLFALAGVFQAALLPAGQHSVLFTVLAFGIITSCMTGINTLLVSFIPTYFAPYGTVSTMAGLLNASVYVGSSLSTFGIGLVADRLGWNAVLIMLVIAAALGIAACALGRPGWRRFTTK